MEKQRYWIQEDLLTVPVRGKGGKKRNVNIAQAVIEIIDAYVAAKREAFESFFESCRDTDLLQVRQKLDPVGSLSKIERARPMSEFHQRTPHGFGE